MNITTATRRSVLAGFYTASVCASLMISGCSDEPATSREQPTTTQDDSSTTDPSFIRMDTYTGIVGQITLIPDGSNPKQHAKIHHVQIPDFKNESGEVAVAPNGVIGMRSMTMEFPLGEGVSLADYAIGDKVKFDFEVTWAESVSWEITTIEKLDPDFELDYSNRTAEPTEP